jgi:hypothetical protein
MKLVLQLGMRGSIESLLGSLIKNNRNKTKE